MVRVVRGKNSSTNTQEQQKLLKDFAKKDSSNSVH
jgi:hypothetical protein